MQTGIEMVAAYQILKVNGRQRSPMGDPGKGDYTTGYFTPKFRAWFAKEKNRLRAWFLVIKLNSETFLSFKDLAHLQR